jgi:hypothetical protein
MVAFGGEGQAEAGLEVPSDPNPVSQTYTVEATVTDRAGNPTRPASPSRTSHRDLTG